jgi:HSP20 family protein
MNLQQLNPWNWFKDEENSESSRVPVEGKNTNDSQVGASASHHPFVQLQRNIDQLFDDAFQSFGFPSHTRLSSGLNTIDSQAKVNISSDDKNYHISLAIPGLTEKDISLELHQGKLVIRGEKKENIETKDRHYYRVEHSYGSFQRVLTLPEDANVDGINANAKNGVLDIRVPRNALPQHDIKRIPINT